MIEFRVFCSIRLMAVVVLPTGTTSACSAAFDETVGFPFSSMGISVAQPPCGGPGFGPELCRWAAFAAKKPMING